MRGRYTNLQQVDHNHNHAIRRFSQPILSQDRTSCLTTFAGIYFFLHFFFFGGERGSELPHNPGLVSLNSATLRRMLPLFLFEQLPLSAQNPLKTFSVLPVGYLDTATVSSFAFNSYRISCTFPMRVTDKMKAFS